MPERAYATARISPDGRRAVLDLRDQTLDIWILDLERQTLTPLNRDPAQDMSPVWTPDGRRIVWASTRAGGNPNLFWQASDGTGGIERLTTSIGNQFPTSIAPDGSRVVVFGAGQVDVNLFTVRLQGTDRAVAPLVEGPSTYFGGEISPDGRWLAYHSNESGEFQVYVRPFPDVDTGRWQVSTGGGTRPAWARSGRELFYLGENGLLTAVPVQVQGGTFSAGTPAQILHTKYYAGSTIRGLDLRAYDVAPDGRRFLMIKDADAAAPPAAPTSIDLVVMLGWFEELRARLPGK